MSKLDELAEDTKPWLEYRFGKWEVNLQSDTKVLINCCSNQTIEIDKLYGPLSALGVRILLEYISNSAADWVVYREKFCYDKDGNPLPTEWIEVARWDCQLDWPEANKNA